VTAHARQQVRITQIDGALPNLALMKLSHFHRARGDQVTVTRHIEPGLFEPRYDVVYGSTIFKFSSDRVARFRAQWPDGVLGGTGSGSDITVERHLGVERYERYDYSGFDVDYSIGFTQRGCRLKCKFCVVPQKEGKNHSVNTIADIWRGESHPKKLHLLDNDFFGQPEEQWRARIAEIVDGGFRVCLSQGINVRLINPDAAAALATIEYRNTDFTKRRLYTAWDNLGDEKVFFRGVEMLEHAGIPPTRLMVYMLVGFDKRETWDQIWHRFNRMVERGIRPYPMVFDRSRKDLTRFQRWVNTGLYRAVPFSEYTTRRSVLNAAGWSDAMFGEKEAA
jgi:hypothetical protein